MLGVPWHPELAMGAIASHDVRVLDRDLIDALGVSDADIEEATVRQRRELERQEQAFRRGLPPVPLDGREAVLVDDGLATGATMRAAAIAVRRAGAARVVAAAPVGSPEAVERLRQVCDAVVCPLVPRAFVSVGSWYADFSQVADDEVRSLLRDLAPAEPPDPDHIRER
jgi:putative phosphoribosyl transferase